VCYGVSFAPTFAHSGPHQPEHAVFGRTTAPYLIENRQSERELSLRKPRRGLLIASPYAAFRRFSHGKRLVKLLGRGVFVPPRVASIPELIVQLVL
jgi:hypothetical protein